MAKAAQPPAVQDVHVTNTPNVVVVDPVEVTGAGGGPVSVTSPEPILWGTNEHSALDPFGLEDTWCTDGLSTVAFAQIPPGYRFVIDSVSGQIWVEPGRKVLVSVTGYVFSDGPTQGFTSYAKPVVVPWSGRDVWVVNESVSIPADYACVTVFIDELTVNILDLTLAGHLVPL